ncbi:hypothetical protein EVA_19782 [gut metagenome]|uniref:Uncharacterized protein n=1 Tax=gut metagenome TaxID=749906 RepID=J9BX49_9ZZZZ
MASEAFSHLVSNHLLHLVDEHLELNRATSERSPSS